MSVSLLEAAVSSSECLRESVGIVYSMYKKQRILYYYYQGLKPPTIVRQLQGEKLRASRWGVTKFLKKFRETGTIGRRIGAGRPSKVTAEVKDIVEQQMHADDETTAIQLHRLLAAKGNTLSRRTILRCRTSLGWTFRGSAYFQLIRDVNKQKRLAWAKEHVDDTFADVVWTDECTVQLETHRRFSCHKRGEKPTNKPRFVTDVTHCHVLCALIRHINTKFTLFIIIIRHSPIIYYRTGRNIPPRSTFGLGSASRVLLAHVSLRGL